MKTDDETNMYVYNESRTYPGTCPRCFGADPEPAAREIGGESYIMPILILYQFRNIIGGRESVLPSDTWRPLGRSESWSCITYLIPL